MDIYDRQNKIFDKFSTHYKKALLRAYNSCMAKKKKEVDIDDLFWALLSQKGSLGYESLSGSGLIKKPTYNSSSKNRPNDLKHILGDFKNIKLSESVKKIILSSVELASKYKHNYVGTEHLLYSIVNLKDEKMDKIFKQHQINPQGVKKNLQVLLESTSKFEDMTDAVNSLKDKIQLEGGHTHRSSESTLDQFGTNLTDEVIQKNINPVIGRQAEIERVVQILSRKDKNNPILLGEPGVGKTAIVEGLAKKILERDVPDILIDKKIYALDMPMIVAGTSYRGEFEARVKQIIEEVKNSKNIILFIDEIHNIMGAGSASGTMDAANILKPALARGEIRCIGATTFDDYKKYIEPDNALSRRLQKVNINEPSVEESIKILKGIKNIYEKHHLIKIEDKAIEEAVYLSARYIKDQFLPDKAIDLIDETASQKKVSLKEESNVAKISELKQEMQKIANHKKELIEQGKYNQALALKPKEIEIVKKIYDLEENDIQNKIKINSITSKNRIVNEKDIQHLISTMTKIKIVQSDAQNIAANVEKQLAKQIVGQKQAIAELSATLKRSATGLTEPNRPLGSFIFSGPSGVGKTHTAKVLADVIAPGQNSLIKLDMSEFSEKFNATKLIGAPAGYVGYDEGGQLTEKVKRNPYSVILLDEIEKAHVDVFNLFLQILEDGYLTDSKGKQINFRNALIVMTTNIGLTKKGQKTSIGFDKENLDKLKNIYRAQLEEWMRPELLNRLDEIIVFENLDKKDLEKIANLELEKVKRNSSQKNIKLEWDKATANYIAQKASQLDKGARSIRPIIKQDIENHLAEAIIKNKGKHKTIQIKSNKQSLALEEKK